MSRTNAITIVRRGLRPTTNSYLKDTQSSSSAAWPSSAEAGSSFFDHSNRHEVTRTATAHGSPRRTVRRQPTKIMTAAATRSASRDRKSRVRNEHFRRDERAAEKRTGGADHGAGKSQRKRNLGRTGPLGRREGPRDAVPPVGEEILRTRPTVMRTRRRSWREWKGNSTSIVNSPVAENRAVAHVVVVPSTPVALTVSDGADRHRDARAPSGVSCLSGPATFATIPVYRCRRRRRRHPEVLYVYVSTYTQHDERVGRWELVPRGSFGARRLSFFDNFFLQH